MNANKILKKISVILFLTLCFTGKLCAFELFQFSVAPKYAIQNGQVNEYVLYSNGNLLSELNWEIQNMSMLGFNASMGWEMLLLETNCLWGFPKESGILMDSDWQIQSMKTDYSESDNYIDYMGDIELRIGINIKTWNFMYIIPYFGINYHRVKFTARDGTAWYGSGKKTMVAYNDASVAPQDLYELAVARLGDSAIHEVITYDRETFNYILGLKVKVAFLSRFTISSDCGLSLFTQINSLDDHILKGMLLPSASSVFLDKMQDWFKSYYLGTEVDVKIWKGLSAGIGLRFCMINQMIGKDMERKKSAKSYSNSKNGEKAAASGYSWNIETFVRYSF